ncbi:hypothetical protein IJZ97_01545 [bacterium]|nr:hypothetical protein [bacterium]
MVTALPTDMLEVSLSAEEVDKAAKLVEDNFSAYVKDIIGIQNGVVTATRVLEDGIETVQVQTPALLCVLKSDFEPSRPLINGIIKAQDSEVKTLTLQDLELTTEEVGIKGSPTFVSKAFRPEVKHNCEKHDCLSDGKGAEIILQKLKEIEVCNG